jgi:lactoylglutathione lyase
MTFIPAEQFGLDVSAVYHVGYVVEDLVAAMAQFTDTIGARWVDHFVDVRYRDHEGATVEVNLHTSFSLDGPTHIELIEAAPDTIWQLGNGPSLHHIGLWTDDIPAEAERLMRTGMPAVASGFGPDNTTDTGYFSYHANPLGAKVELVDIAKQQGMHDWMRS